ncbi:MAG: YidC/Oxa1 family membrane protein insertase [Treponema sp.]|nr:YidC/Oxa1 family membrane protein insertase [Treponema sp.]
MRNILYTIIIFPLEQIMETAYVFFYRVFDNPVMAVLGISFAVGVFTLPLYLMAEKLKEAERDIQQKMEPVVKNIKAVFSGDERFMRLATYYRENNYHPVYALRNSISLIIQIPFFIAAYHFLSNLSALDGVSFGPIADLAKPDGLFAFGGFTVHILPLAMTAANCLSAALYTRGFPLRDKVQLYGMAAVFLVLLYNSPSGLVLYWTGNNVFSLAKNILQKTKYPGKTTYDILSTAAIILDCFLLFFHSGLFLKRAALALVLLGIPFFPVLSRLLASLKKNGLFSENPGEDDKNTRIFVLSLGTLFFLSGLVIPSALIASSVQEFSFAGNSPFPFIVHTIFQSAGFFLFWPLSFYRLFGGIGKSGATIFAVILAVLAGVNTFLFPGDYGYLTPLMTFSQKVAADQRTILLNIAAIFAVSVMMAALFRFQKKLLPIILTVAVFAFAIYGGMNGVKMYREYKHFRSYTALDGPADLSKPVYRFSKTGRNMLVIMLDRAISGYVPYIFDETPGLKDSFDGFTWYKNTISFGGFTNFGAPGIFGGYEYAPLEMQKRDTVPLAEKHNEALLLLPRLFLDRGFEVTVTNPPYANYQWIADLSIFAPWPQIRAENLDEKYTVQWQTQNLAMAAKTANILKERLIRFSFFKFAPSLFRRFIYDDGNWLYPREPPIPTATFVNYAILDMLPSLTSVTAEPVNTYTALTNDLTHEPSFLEVPGYTLSAKPVNRGGGPFAHEDHYHVNTAALILLGKWFDHLRAEGVYDNTRIIIVSDHGRNLYTDFPGNITLPNGHCLEFYTALFLVKDFNAEGFSVDDSFMTNADTPLLALSGLVENPVNPWTGKRLESDKENGITLTTSQLWEVGKHPRYTFDIKKDEWLHVQGNIFDPASWRMAAP